MGAFALGQGDKALDVSSASGRSHFLLKNKVFDTVWDDSAVGLFPKVEVFVFGEIAVKDSKTPVFALSRLFRRHN